MKRQAGDQPHHEIEEAAHHFPEHRLMHADQRAVERAGADGRLRVFAFDGVPEPVELLDRRGEVGIGEERPIAFARPACRAGRSSLCRDCRDSPARARRQRWATAAVPSVEPSLTTTISANSHGVVFR